MSPFTGLWEGKGVNALAGNMAAFIHALMDVAKQEFKRMQIVRACCQRAFQRRILVRLFGLFVMGALRSVFRGIRPSQK